MANQLISHEIEPRVAEHLTVAERIALWADLLDASEELLMAGLRREIGPNGDLRAAYRQWSAQQYEEHDRMWRRIAQRLYERGMRHGQ